MKRCQACDRRAALAEVHCRGCGAAIVPPPPRWLANVGRAFWALAMLSIPLQTFQGWRWLQHEPQGQAVAAFGLRTWRYLVENGSDIAGIVLAFIVAPLVGLYFAFKAMVDIGDAIELKVQQWRAKRFRKYGW